MLQAQQHKLDIVTPRPTTTTIGMKTQSPLGTLVSGLTKKCSLHFGIGMLVDPGA